MGERRILNPLHAVLPFWMLKLTEVWGESKTGSKGEDKMAAFKRAFVPQKTPALQIMCTLILHGGIGSQNVVYLKDYLRTSLFLLRKTHSQMSSILLNGILENCSGQPKILYQQQFS